MKVWADVPIRRSDAGLIVAPRTDTPGIRGSVGTLWIGEVCRVGGDVRHGGGVILGLGVQVEGAVEGGHEVVVGSMCQVRDVRSRGRVVVQAQAVVGDIEAGGDVLLLGDARTGDIDAGGDIIIAGEPTTGALRPAGRVTTRAW